MFTAFDTIYYILLFIAIYFQVFFLVVFFEKRKSIEEKIVHPEDADLPSVSFLIPCWNEAKSAEKNDIGLDTPFPVQSLRRCGGGAQHMGRECPCQPHQ